MNKFIKSLVVVAMTVTITDAIAQQVNGDWTWKDAQRYQKDLHLGTRQGSRISAMNRATELDIRRLNGMHISGQERALRIRAIHDQARQDILGILDERQRMILHNRGFDVLMSPVQERHVYTLKRYKPKKGHGHGG